jgi:hypothetical protein
MRFANTREGDGLELARRFLHAEDDAHEGCVGLRSGICGPHGVAGPEARHCPGGIRGSA